MKDDLGADLDGINLPPRSPSDLNECEQSARRVHTRDGYLPYVPNDDFVEFLDAIGA